MLDLKKIPEILERVLEYSGLRARRRFLNTCTELRYDKRLWKLFIHHRYMFYVTTNVTNILFTTKMLERYLPIPTSTSLQFLSSTGNLNLLKFFFENCKPKNFKPIHLLEYSVESGHVETTKWLYTLKPDCLTPGEEEQIKMLVKSAAMYGHLELLQWFDSQGHHIPITCLNSAASGGHLQVVKWLHNFKNYCSMPSLASAAQNGNLETVQWLWINCKATRKYVYQAMESASLNSQFEVLKWLQFVTNQEYLESSEIQGYLYRKFPVQG